MTVFEDALDDIYADENFGKSATYTPPAGAAQPITARVETPDPEAQGLDGYAVPPATQTTTLIAFVRRREVPAPVNEATVVIGGQSYTLKTSRLTRDGIEWIWDLEPA